MATTKLLATCPAKQSHHSSGPRTTTESLRQRARLEATALAELGDLEEGLRLANACATEPDATADAIADAAYMHAVCGRLGRARSLLARFERGDARWSRELGAQAQGWFARFAIYVSEGNINEARSALRTLQGLELQALDARSRIAVVAATLAVIERSAEAAALVKEAMAIAASQNAWRWMARARILDAVVHRDPESLATWISETESESALALLELADVVASAVGTLAPLPSALERSILREPTRWVNALARNVRGRSGDASAAASLVARFGTADEALLLREFERGPSGKPKRKGLATQLIRRVSPTVRVHDLGLTSYEIGERRIALTETRRKSAALLLFLVTRSDLAANREQVMEALWPDQTPEVGAQQPSPDDLLPAARTRALV